jgi:asparagine synthase (glutamine-hydrolysing)
MGIKGYEERMSRWFGALNVHDRQRLVALADDHGGSRSLLLDSQRNGNTPLRRILFFDQTSWLPDNLLERGDRLTMAASLEARMPFMDTELAALVSRLPDRYRLRYTRGKRILRSAMRQILPESILARPKAGFPMPIDSWLRGTMRDFLHDHLQGPGSLTRAYYHDAQLKRVLAEHANGTVNHGKLLWCLLNLEIWHRVCL